MSQYTFLETDKIVANNDELEIDGTLQLSTVVEVGEDTFTILVKDSNDYVDSITAAELLSDFLLDDVYLKLDQTTPQSVENGAPYIVDGIKTPKIYPNSDSTTAVQILKSDGTSPVLIVDTTNSIINIPNVSDAGIDTDKFLVLDSYGNIYHRTGSEVLSDIGAATALSLTPNYLPYSNSSTTLDDTNISYDSVNETIGIGTTPGTAYKLTVSNTVTNEATGGIDASLYSTVTSAGNYRAAGANYWTQELGSTQNNTNGLYGMINYAISSRSSGLLTQLNGNQTYCGTWIGFSGSINYCYGLYLGSYRYGGSSPGTINNFYDIYIRSPILNATPASVTNDWCIYSAHDANSYLSGSIGIGVTPTNKVHIRDESATTNDVIHVLRLDRVTSGSAQNNIGVGIDFRTENFYSDIVDLATIEAINTDVSSVDKGNLVFKTYDEGGDGLQERVRIKYDGTFNLSTVNNAGEDTGNILVLDSNNDVNLRTSAQLLSDLSGDAAASFDWNSQNLNNIGTLDVNNGADIEGNVDILGTLDVHSTLDMNNGNIEKIGTIQFKNSTDYIIKLKADTDTGVYFDVSANTWSWKLDSTTKASINFNNGNFQCDGQANINGGADIEGNVDISGTLDSHGAGYFYSTLRSDGAVDINNNVDISGTLDVHGTFNMYNGHITNVGTIQFKNSTDYIIKVKADVDTGIYFDVSSNQWEWRQDGTTRGYIDLDNGNLQINGQANIDGGADIEGNVDISGTTDLHGAGHFYSTLQIDGQVNIADTLKLGSDTTGTGDTNNTNKAGEILAPHYYGVGAGYECKILDWSSNSSNNVLKIGGAPSNYGADTIEFYISPALSASTSKVAYFDYTGGFVLGSPTGGSKGAGSLNAQAVYDDNVLLTGYVLDKYYNKNYDIRAWDNKSHLETHENARLFEKYSSTCFDLEAYENYIKENFCLPSFEDVEKNNEIQSTGSMINKLWESEEITAIHVIQLSNKIKNQNKEINELKARLDKFEILLTERE